MHMCAACGTDPIINPVGPDPARQVERWVAERAQSVDERSGQLARSAELLAHARRLLPGAAALAPLEAAAQELQELAVAGKCLPRC